MRRDERVRRSPANVVLSALLLLLGLYLTACGAPGEPIARAPVVPIAVADLAAQQAGDGVQLTFTLPSRSVAGERLAEAPAIEVWRGTAGSNGTPDKKSFQLVYTIPGALAADYAANGRVRFTDPVDPAETLAHPSALLAYRVRTRASEKRDSADSNTVTVAMYPVPASIPAVAARVTQAAIELSWPAPERTSGGALLSGEGAVSTYRVYRGELDAASTTAASAPGGLGEAKWITPLALLAEAPSNEYHDTQFEFGKTYAYTVRSAVTAGGRTLESADSAPVVVTPRDTFPPAVPSGLVVEVLPSSAPGAYFASLSWNISTEADLAGYRVYRSDGQDAKPQLLTPELLLSPAYRDMSVQAGHRYSYTVTAVDRAGNESAASPPVPANLAQPPG